MCCCAWRKRWEIYNVFIEHTFMPIHHESYKIFDNAVPITTIKAAHINISPMSSNKKGNVQNDKLKNLVSTDYKFLFEKNITEVAKYLNIEDYMIKKF